MVSQNQLFPPSGMVMERTRPTLARLMQVQNVSRDAWPRFGTIIPSNLYNRIETKPSTLNPQIVQIYKNELIMSMADKFLAILQQQKYYGEKKKDQEHNHT